MLLWDRGTGAYVHLMKATKYVLVAAGIVAVLATIAWILRDNLIQRISNPLLDDYGISVTDVSLDALATGDATISYLELVHEKGATIAIENLTLPIGTSADGSRAYSAGSVSIITSTRSAGEAFELAKLIDQFLSLPQTLGASQAVIGEFSLAPYPTARDLKWVVGDDKQKLRASIDSVEMSAAVTRIEAENHIVVFSLPTPSASAQQHLVTANLTQHDKGIVLSGTSSLDLPIWQPLGRLSGIVPPEIAIESGTATLTFDADIPYDVTQSPTVNAVVTPSSVLQVTHGGPAEQVTSIAVESGSPVDIVATFPQVEWSLQQAEASLLVSYGNWQGIPVSVHDLACRSGPACSMNTRVAMKNAELPIGNAGQVQFNSVENVQFQETGVHVDVRPGAVLNMTKFAAGDTKIDRIEARFASVAMLELIDSGWRLGIASLDARISAASASDDISITAPLFLDNVLVSELDDSLSASSGIYAPSSQATLNEQSVVLPGFKGDISLQDNKLSIDLAPVGLYRDGIVAAQHDIDSHAGSLTVSDIAVSFGKKSLSDRVSPWPNDRDLIAGTVALDLDTNWTQKKSGVELDAQASIDAADLAGYYADTAFTGLSTQLKVAYHSPTGITAEPSTISVASIETGLLIENLSAAYTLDLNAMSVDVDNLRMVALGGIVRADPFSFHTDRDRNTLTLKAESIDLTELLSLNEFETIEVSGSIGATLPVTIEGETVTIEDGSLTGDPAGGVIRYLPKKEPDESDTSPIGLASRALSNFEFDSLTSDVNLTREGDLNLKLQLTGRNPDLDEKRPVVLNLGVENNIPQMLKSLRAARAVEAILEERLNR